jgi:hypothetical protein
MTSAKNHFPTVLWGTLAVGLLCSSCQQQSATGPAGAARHQVSPEASFEQISSLFARSVQTGAGGVDGGFIARREDGHSRLAIRNEVTHQFFPPTKEGEPCRGVITVTSQYDYSIQRIAGNGEAEDKPTEGDEGTQRRRSADDDEGVDVIDRNLVKSPGNGRRSDSEESEDMIARLSDEDVSKYELEYVDNRWVLKTALDPDTERSIENAFNHALSLQP